jgi:diphthamide biosynthesis protein 4
VAKGKEETSTLEKMSKPTTKTPNYYTTLNLSTRKYDPTLTPAEVKAAYKRALLQHHPDKRPSTSTPPQSSNPKNKNITIDSIALAYKILSSPSLKAEYDSHLQQTSRSHNNSNNNNSTPDSDSEDEESDKIFRTGLETVDLDDLEFVDESGSSDKEATWTRGCRCGDDGGFVVTEKELEANAEDGEVIVGCRGCSLWLRVLFGVEG